MEILIALAIGAVLLFLVFRFAVGIVKTFGMVAVIVLIAIYFFATGGSA